MVGTLIRVGDAWRIVELPSLGSEGEAIAQTTGNFFTPGGIHSGNSTVSAGMATQKLVNQLEQVDELLAAADKNQRLKSYTHSGRKRSSN